MTKNYFPKVVFTIVAILLISVSIYLIFAEESYEESSDEDTYSNTELVRNASLVDYDPTITIKDALENYKYFINFEWNEFTTEQGRDLVEFRGYYYKYNALIIIQFAINKTKVNGYDFVLYYSGFTDLDKPESAVYKSNKIIEYIYINETLPISLYIN